MPPNGGHKSHQAWLWLILFFVSVDYVDTIQLLRRSEQGPTEDRVPDPPKNFHAEQLTPNSVALRWEPPPSASEVLVRGYTISYGTDTADARKVVLEGADSTQYTLNSLKPNTSYVFSLTAYNEAQGEDSARVLLLSKTPPLPARDAPEPDSLDPLKPTGLRLERTRQRDEILLHWDEPTELTAPKPLYYVIQYWRDAVKDREQHRLTVERSPALLTGLKPGEKYTAKVRAVFADGSQSPWSDKFALNGRERMRGRWGGARDAEEEEDFCGFELPSVCDFIREGSWRWQRRNSTKDGYNMVLRESIKPKAGEEEPPNSEHLGRLLSPVYGLRPSETFCFSVQLKLAKGGFGAMFRLGVRFEGEQRPVWLYRRSLQRFWPQGEWQRLSFQLRRRPPSRGFQVIFEVAKQWETAEADFSLALDNLFVRAADCPLELEPFFGAAPDEETEANLLIPLENLIDTDPRVFRTTGLDGLPAVGIKRGVEIVVPYRIYLPRKFYRNFAILASVRPTDHQGGFLFAVLNAFDTVVELGVQLQPAGPAQTNISLLYTDSQTEKGSRVLASFLVPAFTGQWTQFALEVHEQTVGLYFRCMRFAIRQVHRRPAQLQMDDASKLYIANAGPILGGGFEGAIQELKLHDDPAEAANQCNENWWKTRRRENFSSRQKGGKGEGNKKKPRPKDAEKAGLGSSGFGPPEEEIQGEHQEESEETPTVPISPAPPPPARPPMQRMTSTTTTTQTPPMLTTTKQPAQHIWEGAMAPPMPGPKGEKGERGEPGQCAAIECPMPPPGPPGLPGLPGAPGEFPGLTDSDLARISAWPGLKGAKGDKGECPPREAAPGDDQAEVVLLNGKHQKLTELPPYNARVHGNGRGQKGEKGERGIVGPMGPPGLPGPPAVHQQQQKFEPQQAMPAVSVYQTALELLAAAPRCPVGSLAFAISTQQLFLRVHAGWRQVMLDKSLLAQPAAAAYQYQQQPVAAPQHLPVQLDTSTDSELSRLAYWLALDEPANNGGNGNDEAIVQPPPAKSPILPEAQPWRARWPPKEIRPLMEEFEEEQRRKEAKEKNRVQSTQFRHKDRVIHLIALNEPLSGDFGGVRGADLECYRQARQAGFGTTFRAFLSSRVQDLNKLVHADDRHQTPVVNIRGERLFDSWDGVFDGGAHAHVPLYSFAKRDIFADWAWSERWLWHGSTREGLRSNAYCSEWRSSAADDVGMASPLHTRHSLTEQAREMPCDRRLAVLCIEVMSKFNVDLKLGKRFMADLRQ